jgi:quinol monooxygenase YgiN
VAVVVQLMVRLTVVPGRVQETVQALRAVMQPARLNRDCICAKVCADVENPTILCYGEDWSTRDALDREVRSRRFTQLLEVMESSVDVPALEFRFFSEIRGPEFAESDRVR